MNTRTQRTMTTTKYATARTSERDTNAYSKLHRLVWGLIAVGVVTGLTVEIFRQLSER